MGLTMTEKILARTSGQEATRPGDIVVSEVDRAVVLDMQFSSTAVPWRQPLRIARPERLAVILDHGAPAPSTRDANGHHLAREFCERFEIEDFFDIGKHGICHQIIAERGLARPGELLVCSDSHTCAGGAFNSAARGVGGLEMIQIICTGTTWFVVAPTVRVELRGRLGEDCEGKDVFLALAGKYGSADNRNLEFVGDGISSLSLHDRRTVATQCAEINAEFSIFASDGLIESYLAERGVTDLQPVEADSDAVYDDSWSIELDSFEPQIATPGKIIGNVAPVGDHSGLKLDQCFIGSCANGHLEDFAVAASVLDGRTVSPGTRLIVTPASQQVYLDAVRAGYVATIMEAGGVVTSSTCGACFGYHMGVLGEGEVCLTASTRNFKGRMGSPSSEVYMASARTVAASAVTGVVTDPRELG
ncbi:MAG: 3-isopropylmalate dehydratase large subunit [Gaiellaceae bacterium]